MPLFRLDDQQIGFPPPQLSCDDGLLAVGGGLSPEWILTAYSLGIFPWYSEGEPIYWWSPDPRLMMHPTDIKVSKSMKQVFRKKTFTITLDTDFRQVITNCQTTKRNYGEGTWITNDMLEAYCYLHQLGFAHSVEVWDSKNQQQLVGGLYGLSLGKCFFGESMFAKASNASKAAYIALCHQLTTWQFNMVDCQMPTPHLQSLGGKIVAREPFLQQLAKDIQHATLRGQWQFDDDNPYC